MTVRIVAYNIRKGGRRRRQSIAEVLGTIDADVVLLQEATDPTVVQFVADALDARVVISAPGRSVAVMSRLGAIEGRWHRMARARSFAEVDLPELGLRILAVHLSAGLSARGERRRLREVDRLLAVAGAAPGPERTLIAGDLNAIARDDVPEVAALPRWIRLLLRVDGGIGTLVVDRLLAEGFEDAFRTCHPSESGSTMPAVAPTVRLDYMMVGPGLRPGLAACDLADVDPALLVRASDHVPVVLDLDVPAP